MWRPRWTVPLAAALAAIAVTGCGSGSLPPAATVGTRVVSENELSQELSALDSYPAYAIRLKIDDVLHGDGPDGFSRDYVAQVLTSEIDEAAAENLLAARSAPMLEQRIAARQVAYLFSTAYPGLSFDRLPADYRSTLVHRQMVGVGLAASLAHLDLSLGPPHLSKAQRQATSEAVQAYLRTAKITVARTYGHFDPHWDPPRVIAPTD
jgi:hypothetical protein